PGIADFRVVAEAGEVVGGGEAARAGADDENPLAGRGSVDRQLPAAGGGAVAEKALDRMDRDRLVELGAVTGRLAGMVADAPVDRRHRIVANDGFPCGAVVAPLGMSQPRLDVLAGRAGDVA